VPDRAGEGFAQVNSTAASAARWRAYALVAPALVVIALFFVLPLLLSAVLAFRGAQGGFTFEHFAKAWDYYQKDLLFTVGIVLVSTVLIGWSRSPSPVTSRWARTRAPSRCCAGSTAGPCSYRSS